jgi:hypothetical protein
MADAARNAARDEKAAAFKQKLEQERLAEEQRIAEAETERQRNLETQSRLQQEKVEQDVRDALAHTQAADAEAQRQKDEVVRVAAEKEATKRAEEVSKQQKNAERLALADKEAAESAQRITDALALKAKVEAAAKASGTKVDASAVWGLSESQRTEMLSDHADGNNAAVNNMAASAQPKKEAPKEKKPRTYPHQLFFLCGNFPVLSPLNCPPHMCTRSLDPPPPPLLSRSLSSVSHLLLLL